MSAHNGILSLRGRQYPVILMRADVPVLPVELARLKLSMLAKEAWYYDVPFMHMTIGS